MRACRTGAWLLWLCCGVARTAWGQAHVVEFDIPTPNSRPGGIALDRDSNVWFTELDGNQIGRLTPSGVITEFSLPHSLSTPYRIVAAPDGALWFTENDGGRIGRIAPDGAISEFTLSEAAPAPLDIVVGPDGNLWFTELEGRAIGTILADAPHTNRDFSLGGHVEPFGITVGPDRRLWYSDHEGHIGRITLDGSFVTFALVHHDAGPTDIVTGSDGNLWFTENSINAIGRISLFGEVVDFPLPVFAGPLGIAAGGDGALWFAGAGGDLIGRITTAGVLAIFPLPAKGSFPAQIVAASDGSFWFTEALGNRIGHLTPPSRCLGDCNHDGSVDVDELVRGVSVADGTDPVEWCDTYDRAATIDALLAASRHVLAGCP